MSDNEGVVRGDPNSTRLLLRMLDKLDEILCLHGFEFREDRDWQNFGESLAALVHDNYNDLTGGDSDYDPNAPPDESSEVDSSESVSVSLSAESSSDEVRVNKRKAQD